MLKKTKYPLLLISIFLWQSCSNLFNPWTRYEKRFIKRYKYIRKTEILLSAYYEGTQNNARLNLRKNNIFDLKWNTFLGTSYYVGNWKKMDTSDTICLSYFEKLKPIDFDTTIVYEETIDHGDMEIKASRIYFFNRSMEDVKRIDFNVTKNKMVSLFIDQ